VQGASGHGGEVAGPIATRILERTLAQDEGKFDMHVAWLAPAHKANPLQLIKAVSYTGGNLGSEDGEGADTSQSAVVQLASDNASPDVEPEADARGRVQNAQQSKRALRALPVTTPAPQRPRNFFERLFNTRPRPAAPTPTPAKRPRPAL
jgi:hypothetical protein